MVLKKGIWQALILGALCTGSVSCELLPKILPLPQPTSSIPKKVEPRAKQVKACYPVRNKEIIYIVRKGDTLGEIAACFKTRWYYIAKRNQHQESQPDQNWAEVGHSPAIGQSRNRDWQSRDKE